MNRNLDYCDRRFTHLPVFIDETKLFLFYFIYVSLDTLIKKYSKTNLFVR